MLVPGNTLMTSGTKRETHAVAHPTQLHVHPQSHKRANCFTPDSLCEIGN